MSYEDDQGIPTFDIRQYLRNLGRELVQAYESSQQASTPGTKGYAREEAVRDKLALLLPAGAGVGTGFVIDSEGRRSKQQDLIIYESQFSPVFSVGTVNYYPCETVIAVGEIKSRIGKPELRDIYEKISSVRRLNKFPKLPRRKPIENGVHYRRHLSKEVGSMKGDLTTIQNSSSATQIYGFGFGGSFGASPDTMINHTVELINEFPQELRPNVVLTLAQTAIVPSAGTQVSYTSLNHDGATFLEFDNSLEFLLAALFVHLQNGITSPGDVFEIYMKPSPFNAVASYAPD